MWFQHRILPVTFVFNILSKWQKWNFYLWKGVSEYSHCGLGCLFSLDCVFLSLLDTNKPQWALGYLPNVFVGSIDRTSEKSSNWDMRAIVIFIQKWEVRVLFIVHFASSPVASSPPLIKWWLSSSRGGASKLQLEGPIQSINWLCK